MNAKERRTLEGSLFEQNVVRNHHFRNRSISKSLLENVLGFIRIHKEKYSISYWDFLEDALSGKNDDFIITWLPAYSCALVSKRKQGCLRERCRLVFLVGATNYDMRFQHEWASDVVIQTAGTSTSCSVPCVQVKEKDFETFLQYFETEFDKVYEEDKRKRLGRHKKMSPALVQFALDGAYRKLIGKEVNINRSMEGGWSDVLHHTGGDWPLLSAVIEFIAGCSPLPDPTLSNVRHQHLVCHMLLEMLEARRKDVNFNINSSAVGNDIVSEQINDLMIMMECIAHKAVNELSGVEPIDDIAAMLNFCRNELECNMSVRWLCHAHSFQIKYDIIDVTHWSINVPSEPAVHKTKDFSKISNIARSNIGLLPLSETRDCQEVLELVTLWGKYYLEESVMFFHLLLNTVEYFFHELALRLVDANFRICIVSVEGLVNEYRKCNRKLLNHLKNLKEINSKSCDSLLITELLSNEMLITWTGFVLIHKTLKQDIPLLCDYGVPLRWQYISLLLLSKKEAYTAALRVSGYLRSNTKEESEIFCLNDQTCTLSFALRFAEQSPALLKIWEEEVEAAENRETKQWEKVIAKQTEVMQLNKKLNELNDELNYLQEKELGNEFKESEALRLKTYRFNLWSQWNHSNSQIMNVEEKISATSLSLKKARRPPEPIFQPLPRSRNEALRILFFLHMPDELKLLARMAISARQIILPNEDFLSHTALDIDSAKEIAESIRVDVTNWTSWTNFYNSHSPSKKSSNEVLHLFSEFAPAKRSHVGPSDVMDIQSPNQSVWHPDELKPTICWNGGGFSLDSRGEKYFNPYVRCNEEIFFIEYFTEKLTSNMQFALTQYGKYTAASRSNRAFAKQKDKPGFMNRSEWFTFASLRAYPNQHLRKLCCALRDRSLPFEEPDVHIILLHILYHIGQLVVVEGDVQPVWKTDMIKGEFLSVIADELRNLSSEIEAKPSQHQTMLFLIEISRYVAQWSAECVTVLRSFLQILDAWIVICDDQLAQTEIFDVPSLTAKKALFYNYAILCYSCGELASQDLSNLCGLLVRAQNEAKSNSDSPYEDQLRVAIELRQKIIASRSTEIIQKLKNGDSDCLTVAVRAIISGIPRNLKWTNVVFKSGKFSSCFEARDANENLYSINVMNGIVLCNGVPPSELPQTILNHALYKRTFGDRNFQTHLNDSVIQTVVPVSGCFYSFSLTGEILVVKEKNTKTSVELTLLDGTCLSDETSWGYDLPIILKKKFSHWYCPKRRAIIFRGVTFLDRSVHFISILKNENWHCYRIPSHQKQDTWNSFLKEEIELERTFDELLKVESSTVKVLSKFENAANIHCYRSPDQLIIYHLPRFDLEFYFDPNLLGMLVQEIRVYSRDYSGYHLSPCQQLDDTLYGFEQYLVLEHNETESADTKIIIPQGKVVKIRGLITVEPKDTPNSGCFEVYTYDVHPRFRNLTATSIHSRLHLADLYAACSTLLPERRMQMCGSEVAMELVRRSWTNKPLDQTDYDKLKSICQRSNLAPALNLLCHEVACSSLQTDFLHTQKVELNVDEELLTLPKTASAEYMQESLPRKVRISLTPEEEIRVLGTKRVAKSTMFNIDNYHYRTECPGDCIAHFEDETSLYERQLCNLVKKTLKDKCEFFLKQTNGEESKLRKFVLRELEDSHNALFDMEEEKLTPEFQSVIEQIFFTINKKRKETETSIITCITNIPKSCDDAAKSFLILRSANIYPLLTLEDIVKYALRRRGLKHFNPFHSSKCYENLYYNIIIWMKLCVLEDKLIRLKQLCKRHSVAETHSRGALELQIIQEVSVSRRWPSVSYPEWLAFEVIAGLQIRPIQSTVAELMIVGMPIPRWSGDTKGPITQLNMGEGKTRVILPMLAMHFTRERLIRGCKNLVRFNFLAALLQEAGDYLHSILSATVIGIKIFYFPFNRDVQLTAERVDTLAVSLEHCLESGGVIICAPEHRMSLKLKRYELTVASKVNRATDCAAECQNDGETESESTTEMGKICKTLEKIDSFQYVDVLDEVDEILRAQNKLIYAVGSQEQLSSRNSRINVLQALLDLVSSNESVKCFLQIPQMIQGKVGGKNETFQEFRILRGTKFKSMEKYLIRCLAEELILNPPFELKWMRKTSGQFRSDMIRYATEPQLSQFEHETAKPSHLDDILALRGFLAAGLFVHCLTKRNRVDYGVNRLCGKNKLMAVPFRACEIPSLRAEFAHPDCALMYTCLAYYYDGLSFEQVQEAFKTLLLLGESAQKTIYREWFDLCSPRMTFDEKSLLDEVAKLDLSNSVLAATLFKYFQKNIKTINFWLNNCVFPVETAQFPYRLEATAWDVAHNSTNRVAGFSGTNDDRLIMPSSLKWVMPSLQWADQVELSLLATDGKMLQLLAKSNFESLQINDERMKWKIVLDAVLEKVRKDTTHVTCALIDAGALMAGASNNVRVAASHLPVFGQSCDIFRHNS